MRRLLCVALLGAMMGVLAYGAGTATAAGADKTTATHFTASYTDWTGAHYVCSGFRIVTSGPTGSAPPMDKEVCLADLTSAWYVIPAGTYTIGSRPIGAWISDYDGLWATSGTITIIQRVPGIQLLSIVAWY